MEKHNRKIYSVLLVDADASSLSVSIASLKRWNYEVTAVGHALDALDLLHQKSFDLVLTDVHLPELDGLELMKCIKKYYGIPVILTSKDIRSDLIDDGIKKGAETFLQKPIMPDAIRDMWQIFELRKVNQTNNTMIGSSLAKVPTDMGQSSRPRKSDDKVKKRTTKLSWTPRLHSRFVDALLNIGYHKANPKTILEDMNEPGISREQVASHLQKYRRLVNEILDGKISHRYSKYYTNRNYNHSNVVDENPNLFLLKKLKEERRTSKDATPIQATLSLSRFNQAGSSSRMDVMSTSNYASSAGINIEAHGISSGIPTSQRAGQLKIRDIIESNTAYNNPYEANQMNYYGQTTVVPQWNNNSTNRGLVGSDDINGRLVGGSDINNWFLELAGGSNINNWFLAKDLNKFSSNYTESIYNISTSEPLLKPWGQDNPIIFNTNNSTSEPPLNLGGQSSTIIFNTNNSTFGPPFNSGGQDINTYTNNFDEVQINSDAAPYIGCSFAENQVVHTLGMDDELRAMQTDLNACDGSLGTNLFGNTFKVNEQIGNMQPVGLDIGTSLASNQVENTFTMNEEQQNGDGSGYELHNFTIFSPSPSKLQDWNI
ncbi:hypothetical protein DCAR_0102912 [Daucus carota subsp. sativus]|uniref:Response regulatory domain-containing protein n=1 Tax=Daucus carota subsp. sativus TaxID=79200 RepID=A0AAF0W5Z8_DAUCS|nr:PREDICTED: two-component response regulator ARR14-like [Daucus carota subsp. sativus]WOG83734.1 hypothetical protein DCAR_0102912 [Daucus carota subsp. sativus]